MSPSAAKLLDWHREKPCLKARFLAVPVLVFLSLLLGCSPESGEVTASAESTSPAEVQLQEAQAALQKRKFEKAKLHSQASLDLAQATGNQETAGAASLVLAEAQYGLRDLKEARATYQALLPNRPELRKRIDLIDQTLAAEAVSKREAELKEARKTLKEAQEYFQKGELSKASACALESYEKSQNLGVEAVEALCLRAKIHAKRGDFKRAFRLLDEATTKNPKNEIARKEIRALKTERETFIEYPQKMPGKITFSEPAGLTLSVEFLHLAGLYYGSDHEPWPSWLSIGGGLDPGPGRFGFESKLPFVDRNIWREPYRLIGKPLPVFGFKFKPNPNVHIQNEIFVEPETTKRVFGVNTRRDIQVTGGTVTVTRITGGYTPLNPLGERTRHEMLWRIEADISLEVTGLHDGKWIPGKMKGRLSGPLIGTKGYWPGQGTFDPEKEL